MAATTIIIIRRADVNLHKNTKDKLLTTNASIWYNKVCRANYLAPKYGHINIRDNNPRNVATKKPAIL